MQPAIGVYSTRFAVHGWTQPALLDRWLGHAGGMPPDREILSNPGRVARHGWRAHVAPCTGTGTGCG
jgi:hypothetical protein